MHTLYSIDATLRHQLAPLFTHHHRVDFGIDSIMEGQQGRQLKVVVDDVASPAMALLRYGTFGVLGGDASHADAPALIAAIERPCAIQPSPDGWMPLLQQQYADSIKKIERFSFTHENIQPEALDALIAAHPLGNQLHAIDAATATTMQTHEWHQYHLSNYTSASHFSANGFATGISVDGVLASVCSAALHCSKGIELNVITLPDYRGQGLGALVAAHVIKKAVAQGLVPHWDAANERSARLALRLGYQPAGNYFTTYLPG